MNATLTSTDYVYPVRVSWPTVLDDLHDAGVSYHRVSSIIGVGWSTLYSWRLGHEPRHSYGGALLTLHTLYCGEELTKLRQSEGVPVV